MNACATELMTRLGASGGEVANAPSEADAQAAAVAEWVAQAQGGDARAFERLYRAHVGRVYAVCRRMARDEVEAEDLTQEAFVRAWQKLDKFRGDAQFGTWLHRLTVNLVLSHCRGHGKRWKALEMTDDLARYEGGGGTDPRLFAKVASEVSGRFEGEGGVDGSRGSVPVAHPGAKMDLEQAIGTLPEGARQVFVLHDVEGYKHHEIAEMAGIAVGTAKAQLHRARKLLREVLA